jgi:hypothetical protein
VAETDSEDQISTGEIVAFALLVATFSIPSLMLNLNVAQLSRNVAQLSHSTVAQLSLNVASVVAAPLFCHAMIFLARQRKPIVAATVGVIFITTVGYNLATALGNVALSRATVAETRAGAAVEISRLEAKRTDLLRAYDRARELSQGVSPEIAAQEVSTLKRNPLYTRSVQCTNDTAQDSIDLCTLFRGAERKMLAAKEARRLQSEMDSIDLALEGRSAGPADADPQVANVTALVSLISPVEERWVSVLLNAYAAIIAELLGAFSPFLFLPFAHRFRAKKHHPVAGPIEPCVEEIRQEAPAIEPPALRIPDLRGDPVEQFLQCRLRHRQGSEVTGRDLYAAYSAFCHEGSFPVMTMRKLSDILAEHGLQKERRRNVVYLDVEIIPSSVIMQGINIPSRATGPE